VRSQSAARLRTGTENRDRRPTASRLRRPARPEGRTLRIDLLRADQRAALAYSDIGQNPQPPPMIRPHPRQAQQPGHRQRRMAEVQKRRRATDRSVARRQRLHRRQQTASDTDQQRTSQQQLTDPRRAGPGAPPLAAAADRMTRAVLPARAGRAQQQSRCQARRHSPDRIAADRAARHSHERRDHDQPDLHTEINSATRRGQLAQQLNDPAYVSAVSVGAVSGRRQQGLVDPLFDERPAAEPQLRGVHHQPFPAVAARRTPPLDQEPRPFGGRAVG
jgi:hypothetical protein